jgi:hypothetical protein
MIYIKIIMKYHKHKDLNAPPLASGLERHAVSDQKMGANFGPLFRGLDVTSSPWF